MSDAAIDRVRKLCLALPEVVERLSHGEPTFFVQNKRSMLMVSNHHHDDRVGFWCAAPTGAQEAMISEAPDRYFRPPYVGHRGWLGVYLDVDVDWEEIRVIVLEAYRVVAPKGLVKGVNDPES